MTRRAPSAAATRTRPAGRGSSASSPSCVDSRETRVGSRPCSTECCGGARADRGKLPRRSREPACELGRAVRARHDDPVVRAWIDRRAVERLDRDQRPDDRLAAHRLEPPRKLVRLPRGSRYGDSRAAHLRSHPKPPPTPGLRTVCRQLCRARYQLCANFVTVPEPRARRRWRRAPRRAPARPCRTASRARSRPRPRRAP